MQGHDKGRFALENEMERRKVEHSLRTTLADILMSCGEGEWILVQRPLTQERDKFACQQGVYQVDMRKIFHTAKFKDIWSLQDFCLEVGRMPREMVQYFPNHSGEDLTWDRVSDELTVRQMESQMMCRNRVSIFQKNGIMYRELRENEVDGRFQEPAAVENSGQDEARGEDRTG